MVNYVGIYGSKAAESFSVFQCRSCCFCRLSFSFPQTSKMNIQTIADVLCITIHVTREEVFLFGDTYDSVY